MNIRTFYKTVISVSVIMILAMCGVLLTHCKKYEVSSAVIVKTEGVSEITANSCRAAGMLVDIGSTGVTQHGFCWSLTSNVAEAIDCKNLGSKNDRGAFNDIIEGFTPGTEYHIWAYAQNEDGRKYGQAIIFTTVSGSLPTVHTNLIEQKTATTALAGGSISDDGGAEIFEKGVCSDVNPDPTIETNVLHAGGNPDPFELTIEGLLPNTTYYVRAFASNVAGTGYGENQEFKTLPEFGELVDERDGKHYQTVKIGEQWWMAQNLDRGQYIARSFPLTNNDFIEKYCYDDNPENCEVYGALYTWEEVMQFKYDDPHGVCPEGWHIPSDEEWRFLEMTIGMTEEATHIEGQRGADINAGGKLRAIGSDLWREPNMGATDEFGFHAVPGGMVFENGVFFGLGEWSPLWTSTLVEPDVFMRGVAWDHNHIHRGVSNPMMGYSVRCVKD